MKVWSVPWNKETGSAASGIAFFYSNAYAHLENGCNNITLCNITFTDSSQPLQGLVRVSIFLAAMNQWKSRKLKTRAAPPLVLFWSPSSVVLFRS